MKAWLSIFGPVALIIGAAFALYAYIESRRGMEALIEHERAQLRMAESRLTEMLVDATTDLRIIAGAPALRAYLTAAPGARDMLEALLASFVNEDLTYDQLRVVDPQGRERVRVRRTPEGAHVAQDEELRSERGSDYLQQALALLPGQIHVTRLALSTERGKIEIPRHPVLRLASRQTAANEADFVLVSNLRGAVLVKGLRDFVSTAEGQIWLLDSEGYWLMHPDPWMLWGFQLDATHRVQQQLPALAAQLQHGSGSLTVDGALYVHRRFQPLERQAREGLVDLSPAFDLVSRTPPERLPALLPTNLWLPLAVVLALAAFGSALFSRALRRSADAERRERELLEERASTGELRSWIRERVYQLSLKIHSVRDLESFGTAVLAELAPTLNLAAARLYALRDQRAHPVAGFGLPPRSESRDFAPGEGLVGEALRTRDNLRLRPPPAGYLDLGGGLGQTPAADLRVLPLWVHSRTVGVLELALWRVLEPREEEFLRQALPLLALNLDSLLDRPRGAKTVAEVPPP